MKWVWQCFPMKAFVGRAMELGVLEGAYAGEGSAFFPVYGRRRVGKTELLLKFLEGKRSVFYLGKQADEGYQVGEFLEAAAAGMEEPLLAEIGEVGWKRALELVVAQAKGEKLVIVLDEFQWIVGASPGLPSILQELWDRKWSKAGNVMLVLCGSYMGFMEREVLGKKSPLFGRRTGQMLVEPFGFREAAGFHPKLSRADQARVWALCGGVPFYLKQFDGGRSVAWNIQTNFLTPHAALFREADFLLREELREVEHYHAVLMELATGVKSAAEISRATGIATGTTHYYLKTLVELGYVGRRYPMTGKLPTARSVRFALADPLLQFWFRYGFPNLSKITQLGGAQAYSQLVAPSVESFYGARFEQLCREALLEVYVREGVSAGAEVGEYWDKSVQVDLVGVRDDGWIDLGECKWGTVRSWPAVVREVEEKADRYPNPKGRSLGRWVFTRQRPPKKERDGVRLLGLEELY